MTNDTAQHATTIQTRLGSVWPPPLHYDLPRPYMIGIPIFQLGAKDIRKDLRKKRHLDRLENATTELDDEVSFATFLAQGEHELK